MYTIDEMRVFAERLGFREAYMAEKDYLQELLLRALFSRIPENRLVFRGGTALAKVYGSGRFSDDLDFVKNWPEKNGVLLKEVEDAIRSINYLYETTFTGPEIYRDMVGYEIKIKEPLFSSSGHAASVQTVSLDINTYENVVLAPMNIIRTPIYNDIPPYSLSVKQLEELLMDKVVALMERKRLPARDLYDIWIILRKGNLDDLKIKTAYKAYKEDKGTIAYSALVSRTDAVGKVWKKEISSLVGTSIDFKSVADEVKARLKALLRL